MAEKPQYTVFNFTKPHLTRFGSVIVKPGMNRVSLDVARVLKHRKDWKHAVESGAVVIHTGKIPDVETGHDATPETANSLQDLSANKAVEIVNQTFDVELLGELEEEEKEGKARKSVVGAIGKQLEKLTEKPEADEQAGDESGKDTTSKA